MSQDSIVTATPERVRRARGSYEGALVDDRVRRQADRIVPVLEAMRRRGQITEEELAAGERYCRYRLGISPSSGLVGAYGDERWSGTTASQAREDMTREEWRHYCGAQIRAAHDAIGSPEATRALVLLADLEWTLECIGRDYLHAKSPPAAMAAGAVLIKLALSSLARHYGLVRDCR